jgi:hypothetical protein
MAVDDVKPGISIDVEGERIVLSHRYWEMDDYTPERGRTTIMETQSGVTAAVVVPPRYDRLTVDAPDLPGIVRKVRALKEAING